MRIKTKSWTVYRNNLNSQTAGELVRLALFNARSHKLRSRVPAPQVGKASGTSWLALRMADEGRPMILKAPALFRNSLLVIEPSDRAEHFLVRVVDPLTDRRTDPVEVPAGVAEEMVKTFTP